MSANADAARQCIARCIQLRDEGKVEAVLRSEFASWLRSIFPDPQDTSWVNHYSEGAEAATRIGRDDGTTSYRFIDNLVRSTTIEYEADLRQEPRFRKGYGQVKEHVAGAVRSGTPISQVTGVLSDTVDWYVYDAAIVAGVEPQNCTPDDVRLPDPETLQLTLVDEAPARRFIEFLRKHLARQESRPLTASFIATDLGLDSPAYGRHIDGLSRLVEGGRQDDASVTLATDLWSGFVDYLEGNPGRFRTSAYVDEAYVAILARLLCANILQGRAMLSEDDELADILAGQYFEHRFHLHNMVEQDYFGWMLRPAYLDHVLRVAREVQLDLHAYDFSVIREQDLFGRLMTQLARRTQRKLLGQEWTPQWMAKAVAEKCLALIPSSEAPCVVDMCCGSGSILSEVIKAAKSAHPDLSFADLCTAATGFDIDPLAVLLSKTTWVVTLADEVRGSADPVTIPVYHADSLFAVTPVTRELPLPGEAGGVVVELYGEQVVLPASLIGPELRPLFDGIVDWAYDEARGAQEVGNADALTRDRVADLVENLISQHELTVEQDLKELIKQGVFALAKRMADLAVDGLNGIWAFILRNTYRPGLLAGQFNALVSNPPWLAMSQFADNPYKEQLSARALAYGVKPGGAAHLHLELATTHLLHAVDRYLKPGAAVACLVPGTVFNGQHHAKFRDAAYLEADRPVPFELLEVWGVAPGTFKVRSAVVVGVKCRACDDVDRSYPGGAIATPDGVQATPLEVRRLGRRTAWVLGGSTSTVGVGDGEVPPQGADLMPRLAVCVEVVERRGREWRVRTPRRGDPSYFAVKGAKKLQGRVFQGSVAPAFIHRMVQSLNLLPFTLDGNFVQIAIPARRDDEGQWDIMDAAAIRTAGFGETARRFQLIDRAMAAESVVKPLHEKIDERHKLSLQVFPPDRYLCLNGAGGGVACAGHLSLADFPDVVVDQTLYWTLVETEQEALYRVGLINTDALTEAIREFNPEGELGPRHLHTLPNRVIPPFDPSSSDHVEAASLAEQLSGLARPIMAADAHIADAMKPIASRRRRLRERLKQLPEFQLLEDVATAILGVGG